MFSQLIPYTEEIGGFMQVSRSPADVGRASRMAGRERTWPARGGEKGQARRRGARDEMPLHIQPSLQTGWLTRTAGNVQGAEWEQKTVLTPVSALPSLCLSIEFDHRWRYRCPSLLSSASSLVRLHHIGVALILNTRSQDALDTTAERTGQAEELGDV